MLDGFGTSGTNLKRSDDTEVGTVRLDRRADPLSEPDGLGAQGGRINCSVHINMLAPCRCVAMVDPEGGPLWARHQLMQGMLWAC